MNYRPYPNADRALHQVERHHPQVVVTIQPDGRAFGEALRRLLSGISSGAFAANATAFSRSIEHPRRTGKAAITAAIVDQAVKAGEHVHVATRRGVRCHGGDGACGLLPLRPAAPLILARAERTCAAVPSQWNAWTADGQYLYMRYRSGIGTVDAYDTEDSEQWTRVPNGHVAIFDTGDTYGGDMSLVEFCERAGLQLADGAEVTGE